MQVVPQLRRDHPNPSTSHNAQQACDAGLLSGPVQTDKRSALTLPWCWRAGIAMQVVN